MLLYVMAAFDKKAAAFMQPFYASRPEVGLRSFQEAANIEDHQVCKHPEDFSLFQLGTWDDNTGLFQLYPTPKHVAEAINLKKDRRFMQFDKGDSNVSKVA